MGVPTFRFKLLAFAMGAFVGGLAGALFAGRQGFVSPQSFALLLSILFVAAVVVGGQGNRWGVIVGAFVVAYLPERFRGVRGVARAGLRCVLMMLAIYRPQGLLPPVAPSRPGARGDRRARGGRGSRRASGPGGAIGEPEDEATTAARSGGGADRD